MTLYNFKEQKAMGLRGEAYLDRRFGLRYDIEHASDADQRREIDRWFTNRKTGYRFPVEYKTDAIAGHSGNAFVETESNAERHTPGWSVMSEAEFLVYLVLDPETIYAIRFARLREAMPLWETLHEKRPVRNEKYTTVGLLVPLDEFERCAMWTR